VVEPVPVVVVVGKRGGRAVAIACKQTQRVSCGKDRREVVELVPEFMAKPSVGEEEEGEEEGLSGVERLEERRGGDCKHASKLVRSSATKRAVLTDTEEEDEEEEEEREDQRSASAGSKGESAVATVVVVEEE
jgi:hypothetical protein